MKKIDKKYTYNVFFTKCEIVNGKAVNMKIVSRDEYMKQNGGFLFPFDEEDLNSQSDQEPDIVSPLTFQEEEDDSESQTDDMDGWIPMSNTSNNTYTTDTTDTTDTTTYSGVSPLSFREGEGDPETIFNKNFDQTIDSKEGWTPLSNTSDNTYTTDTTDTTDTTTYRGVSPLSFREGEGEPENISNKEGWTPPLSNTSDNTYTSDETKEYEPGEFSFKKLSQIEVNAYYENRMKPIRILK